MEDLEELDHRSARRAKIVDACQDIIDAAQELIVVADAQRDAIEDFKLRMADMRKRIDDLNAVAEALEEM